MSLLRTAATWPQRNRATLFDETNNWPLPPYSPNLSELSMASIQLLTLIASCTLAMYPTAACTLTHDSTVKSSELKVKYGVLFTSVVLSPEVAVSINRLLAPNNGCAVETRLVPCVSILFKLVESYTATFLKLHNREVEPVLSMG